MTLRRAPRSAPATTDRRRAETPGLPPSSQFTQVGVAIPAKDEEELLLACLESLHDAITGQSVPVAVVIVLDACRDRSAAVVEHFARSHAQLDLTQIAIDANCVGAAREAALSALIERFGVDGLWLSSTDADSTVPPHWLSAQLAHARAGAQVVVGTVAVADWSERSSGVRAQAIAAYAATHHRHIHGANLGFAARAYATVGGFPARSSDEDVALIHALEAAGEAIAWAVDLPVTTSARRLARAPQGFAGYLDGLERCAGGPSGGSPTDVTTPSVHETD